MTLIVILIALGLQHMLSFSGWLTPAVFSHYENLLHPLTSKLNDWLNMLILVIPVFVVFGGINYLLGFYWLGFFKIIFSIIILMSYLDATKLNHNAPQQQIFNRAHEYVFNVLFWYAVFGVYGISIYIPIALLSANNKAAATMKIWLDWIPVRLISLTYALIGHFADEFDLLHKYFLGGVSQTKSLKQQMGKVAIKTDDSKHAISLIHRAVILWLVVIAVLTIALWF